MMTGESSLATTGSRAGDLLQLSRALLTMISALSDGIVDRYWIICSPVVIVIRGRFEVNKMATATWTKIIHEPAITD